MKIRTLSGLGDAVYGYPIAKHLARKGPVTVSTKYPEVFSALKNVQTTDDRSNCDLVLRYTRVPGKTQWEEICKATGFEVPFVFDWPKTLKDFDLPQIPQGKKLCIIKEPCVAHMHKSAKNYSMSPRVDEMQAWVNQNSKRFFFVSVGQDEQFKARLKGIDIDLTNKLTVPQLLTLCANAGAIVTQIGHLVPIAQGLRIPLKIFEPEKITDPRLLSYSAAKVRIAGINNEIP